MGREKGKGGKEKERAREETSGKPQKDAIFTKMSSLELLYPPHP